MQRALLTVLTGDSARDPGEGSGGVLLLALSCANGSFLPPLLGLPFEAEGFVFEELAFTPSLELELELLERLSWDLVHLSPHAQFPLRNHSHTLGVFARL